MLVPKRRSAMSRKRRSNLTDESSSEEESQASPLSNFESSKDAMSTRKRKESANSNYSDEVRVGRRGRGPSKRPCLNRNALMARENRQRKKEYLQKIENKLSFYQQENKNLNAVIQKQGIDVKRLNGEVAYLRSVLKNNTSITALLQSMNDGLSRICQQRTKEQQSSNNRESLKDGQDMRAELGAWEQLNDTKNDGLDKGDVLGNCFRKNDREAIIENSYNTKTMTNAWSTLKNQHPIAGKTAHPFLKSDHTYTNPKENENAIDSKYQICPDSNDAKNFEHLLPITPSSLTNSDEKVDVNFSDVELSNLSTLGIDVLDDFRLNTGLAMLEQPESSDGFRENFFEKIDDAGICLHVNSGKVSLEFCSICHLNSLNSEAE
ncbi:CRE-binding bZIP protein SKO1 [Orussus abietinus]|uniref:CRE-binding bZIP protein SKO1 n=1 Tax=Orussus abietinus TaxID=222816 RepID=UPI000626BC30|nr:CRE-binding bZIP protein SKO1 [Orussus abietinus]XP_012278666.1 CRE-binding bZIP protein SKO1 [Orussus abietinus]XP_012278667.1 CRE-binding bZIP protein SKO1 [Orussus abietinus]XP_012278669.1 CRE-binding bZIP protein SKO1 [Orussus abietinus]XP_023289843.1 CRE-binding bZIP protein SKO1 [Orussus abietinus]XP_023289844.1 CRE-binding bZIP protein SKO1 [Orussus abietinus]